MIKQHKYFFNRFNYIQIMFLFFCVIALSHSAKASPKIQLDANYFTSIESDLSWFEGTELRLGNLDNRQIFARIYHSVSLEMVQMFKENQFENPLWVKHLMFKYASLYKNALDCDSYKNCPISPSWQLAFAENRNNTRHPSIQLLLSISAHVNRDLPIALAENETDFSNISIHRDFVRISLIFQRRMAALIDIVKDYQECNLSSRQQEWVTSIVQWAIGRTREKSWDYAKLLVQVQSADQESAVMRQIESHAKFESHIIELIAPMPEFLLCLPDQQSKK